MYLFYDGRIVILGEPKASSSKGEFKAAKRVIPTQTLSKLGKYIEKRAVEAFEQFETQGGVLELKLIRAIDQIELTGLVFGELKEKAIRVYFRIGEQNFKDKETQANSLAKPVLKLRPLDTSNMAYFTESTRRERNG